MLFQLENASVSLGSNTVLNNIQLEIPECKLVFIAGLNGSGKTTLLNVLNSELPLSNGEVLFHGKPIHSYPKKEFLSLVCAVQQLNTLAFDFTAEEFILLGRFQFLPFLGNFSPNDYDLMFYFADKLGIKSLLKNNLNFLSGGELQKVYLAQALIRQTPVLLLDEPSRFLDPFHRNELYELLNSLASEGLSIICVTHDTEAYLQKDAHFIGIQMGKVVWNQIVNADNAPLFRQTVYNIPIPC